MTQLFGVQILIGPWLVAASIIVFIVMCAFVMSSVALWLIRRIVKRSPTMIDDRICQLLERYLFPILTVGGFLLFVDTVPLPAKALHVVDKSLVLLVLFLTFFLLTKAALLFIRGMERHYEPIRNIGVAIETVTKIILIAVGGMIFLDNLGISLTPLVTTLGVGSLAVAIALQDTLGNFFAGLYIKADRPVQRGHYVRLESGQEGYVDHIGWRSTRIRALQNNIVVVPNSKLAQQTTIVNFHLPQKAHGSTHPCWIFLRLRPANRRRRSSGRGEEGRRRRGRTSGSARTLCSFYPRVRRFFDELHSHLPGKGIRGPVWGAT